jgi:hypothetical protein
MVHPSSNLRRGCLGMLALILGASCNYPMVTAAADQMEIAMLASEGERLGQRLWQQSISFDVWTLRVPGLAVHHFIGCGAECSPNGASFSLLDEWLNLTIVPDSIPLLHRGQLLKTLADLDIPMEQIVTFTDGSRSSVEDLIDDLQAELPPGDAVGIAELAFGHEYGWAVAALCHYRGPEGLLRDGYSVPDLLDHMLDRGINRRLEGGSHELEGLAECHRRLSPEAAPPSIYRTIEVLLELEIDAALATIDESGQVYFKEESAWPQCAIEAPACEPLQNLAKQAHFFEWATLSGLSLHDPRVLRAWQRLNELIGDAVETASSDWVRSSSRTWFLYAGTAAHAVRATRKLAALATKSPPDTERLPMNEGAGIREWENGR